MNCVSVHDLIAGIGEGGASLLVVGEAGIGKSSILAEATAFARERGLTILAATGIQAETQLACSGLHQLLRPIIGRIDDLPIPQGNALRAAFGMTSEAAPDLFLTALATLELLSDVAESGPDARGRRRCPVAGPGDERRARIRGPTAGGRADRADRQPSATGSTVPC